MLTNDNESEIKKTDFTVIGNGSNILVRDEGYNGLVIYLGTDFEQSRIQNDTVWAPAGMLLSQLNKQCCTAALTGLEFSYGIPGSVGGAVYMNAGAYGGEMSQVVESVDYLDVSDDFVCKRLSVKECDFAYRHSVFQQNGGIVVGCTFKLQQGDQQQIQATMDELMRRRLEKQPYTVPSAGSTFKRPKGAYAAALIDQCNLRGVSVGDAMVSPKHAGFVVNAGNATCKDVLELIKKVQNTVYETTGFYLECEVRILEGQGIDYGDVVGNRYVRCWKIADNECFGGYGVLLY